MQTTYLITGAAGFIGSCLVRTLLAENDDEQLRVISYDKLTYAGNLDSLAQALRDPRHLFVQGDVCDARLLDEVLAKHRPQSILHLAAESHVDRSIDDPTAFVQTNVLGTYSLLDAARRYWQSLSMIEQEEFRFLHVSTDEVYGSLGPLSAFTELWPYAPNSPYAASKASADHFVRAYHQTYGLPTLTTNCSNNYGPYQFPEKLIPLVVLKALAGEPLPLYGDGLQVRDWLYVEDHVEGLLTVLQQGTPGEVYNIGARHELTNLEVVRQVCRLVDELAPQPVPCESLITFVADRPGHDRRYAIDPSKMNVELGWSAEHAFEEGLRLTVLWYLEHRDWVRRTQSDEYRGQRLGLVDPSIQQKP